VIREESGRQFDPRNVDAFFACLPTIRSLSKRYRKFLEFLIFLIHRDEQDRQDKR